MDAKDRLKNLRAGLDGTIFSAQNHVHSDAERDALVCGLRYFNSGEFERFRDAFLAEHVKTEHNTPNAAREVNATTTAASEEVKQACSHAHYLPA